MLAEGRDRLGLARRVVDPVVQVAVHARGLLKARAAGDDVVDAAPRPPAVEGVVELEYEGIPDAIEFVPEAPHEHRWVSLVLVDLDEKIVCARRERCRLARGDGGKGFWVGGGVV